MQDKKAEKEKEKEDIPSYSKFKYAFERMLVRAFLFGMLALPVAHTDVTLQTQQDFSTKRQETLKKLPPNQKWKLLTQYKGSTLEMLVHCPPHHHPSPLPCLRLVNQPCACFCHAERHPVQQGKPHQNGIRPAGLHPVAQRPSIHTGP